MKRKGNRLSAQNRGFSLIEVLVAIVVLTILGFVVTDILSRTIRGGNKTQLIGVIRQNGQSALDSLDSSIRQADNVVCTGNWEGGSGLDTLVTTQNGKYTRFHFYLQSGSNNGYIGVDYPTSDSTTSNGLIDPNNSNRLCVAPVTNFNLPDASGTNTAVASPSKMQIKASLKVSWSNVSNFGFAQYAYLEPNQSSYFYLTTCNTNPGGLSSTGSCNITAPSTPGTYYYQINIPHWWWCSWCSPGTVSTNSFDVTPTIPQPGIPQDSSSGKVILTDTNTSSGVSVVKGSFIVTNRSGFKPTVMINFDLSPGVSSGGGVSGQIGGTSNSVNFSTTVELRQ